MARTLCANLPGEQHTAVPGSSRKTQGAKQKQAAAPPPPPPPERRCGNTVLLWKTAVLLIQVTRHWVGARDPARGLEQLCDDDDAVYRVKLGVRGRVSVVATWCPTVPRFTSETHRPMEHIWLSTTKDHQPAQRPPTCPKTINLPKDHQPAHPDVVVDNGGHESVTCL